MGESGAGLGLSVVKAIVEAQGGQVGAHNQAQGGAVFWFSLVVNPIVEEAAV
jgi:K+-sensing histidine kinase KdpD